MTNGDFGEMPLSVNVMKEFELGEVLLDYGPRSRQEFLTIDILLFQFYRFVARIVCISCVQFSFL